MLYALGMIPSALILDWAFQGLEQMATVAAGKILTFGIFLGLILLLIKGPEGLFFIPGFQVMAGFSGVIFLFFIFIKNFSKAGFRPDTASYGSLFKKAFPIGLTFIMHPIMLYTDTLMLGFMRGNQAVGYYNSACRITMTLVLLSVFYQDAIYPLLSNFYKTSLELLKKVQFFSFRLMVTAVLPLAVGGTILAKPIINLLYGPGYDAATVIFKILVWHFAFECIYSVFARGLLACSRAKERLKIITIMTVGNVMLNFLLIPPLGVKGAALATVLVRFFGFFLFQKEFNKIVRIPIHNYIFKPALASVIMGLFIYWGAKGLDLNPFLLISAGLSIYLISLYALGGVTREEINLIRTMILKRKEMRQDAQGRF
jgi:O-antigen/teichoic acid export membrane protein